jgi:hypothetical protein
MSLLFRIFNPSLILTAVIITVEWQSLPAVVQARQPKIQQTYPLSPRRIKAIRNPFAQNVQLEPKQPPNTPAASPSPNLNSPAPPSSPVRRQPNPVTTPSPPGIPNLNDNVTIPQSSAIVVSFPAELTLDPKRKYNFPITLSLARPIVDAQGNIVLPARSLISARMKAMKGGDLIEADGVIIGGRVIPINAIGAMVPAQTRPEDFANQFVPSPGPVNNVFNSLVLWQSTALNLDPDLDTYLGATLALLAGLTTPKPKDPPPYVSIPQGTLYILTLAAPITVPRQLVETGLQLQQDNTATDENVDNTAQ